MQDRWGLKVPAQMTLRTYTSEDGGRAAAMLYLHPGPFMCVLGLLGLGVVSSVTQLWLTDWSG